MTPVPTGLLTRWRARRRAVPGEAGNAIVEFVFVGLLVMVPLIYFLLAVFDLQRNTFAVTQAAREAGRAMATAPTVAAGKARAQYAARLALADQGLGQAEFAVSFLPAGTACRAGGDAADLTPGSDFVVCVTRTFIPPGVPTVVAGTRNTVTGRFVVHISQYKAG